MTIIIIYKMKLSFQSVSNPPSVGVHKVNSWFTNVPENKSADWWKVCVWNLQLEWYNFFFFFQKLSSCCNFPLQIKCSMERGSIFVTISNVISSARSWVRLQRQWPQPATTITWATSLNYQHRRFQTSCTVTRAEWEALLEGDRHTD